MGKRAITPAVLADFLERENPKKCRFTYTSGNAHCAIGWAQHLNGGMTPEWVYEPTKFGHDRRTVFGHITNLSDSTRGWGAVIAFLRTLTRNGRIRKGVSV